MASDLANSPALADLEDYALREQTLLHMHFRGADLPSVASMLLWFPARPPALPEVLYLPPATKNFFFFLQRTPHQNS